MMKNQNYFKICLTGVLILFIFIIAIADAQQVITIYPIGDKHLGDKFAVSGTTDLAAGKNILVEIYSSSFQPTAKSQSGEFSGATGTVVVIQGVGGLNTWSFDIDAINFKQDEYIVRVSDVNSDATATAKFNIVEFFPTLGTTPTTPIPTTLGTTQPTVNPTLGGKGIPLNPVISVIALSCVGFLIMVQKRK